MFGLNQDHRDAIADAIRGYINGEKAFNKGVCLHEKILEEWAGTIQKEMAEEPVLELCINIAHLPYTQPEMESSPIKFATFCAALVICNGGDFEFRAGIKITDRVNLIVTELTKHGFGLA